MLIDIDMDFPDLFRFVLNRYEPFFNFLPFSSLMLIDT